jgi:hypothetical protein
MQCHKTEKEGIQFPSISDLEEIKHLVDNYLIKAKKNK